MNELIKILDNLSAGTVLLWIIAACAALGLIFQAIKKGLKLFEDARKAKNESEEKDRLISNNNKDIAALKESDIIITNKINALSDKLDGLTQMLIDMQESNDAKERAQLKDRIREAYSIYQEKGEWNQMEKEALKGLIASYEESGGKNSFVHDVVEKQMYKWKIMK